MAPRKSPRPRPLALAYVRVSTVEQADHGASLDAQRNALTAEAERRGWDVEIIADEGVSAKNLNRPGLTSALDRLDRGEADYLLATRLDRVSRSVADFSGLLNRGDAKGWELRMLSPDLDTSGTSGKFMAQVLAAMAEYERGIIGDRTREGMAQRKSEGVIAGRKRAMTPETRQRIYALRAGGASLQRIADTLTAEGHETAKGGQWRSATIHRALNPALAPGSGHITETTVERVAGLAAEHDAETIAGLLNAESVHTERGQWSAALVRHVIDWTPVRLTA